MSDLRTNEIVMENLHDMMLSQEGRNKIGYVDLACEAIGNTSSQPEMINKLFKETQKIESIDFGRIPDSKGDITKYQYYDQMVDCIDLLTNLSEDNQTTNIVSMNKLHRIMLDARPDFIFGFKTNNFIITSMYKVMVMNLYEMINICVVDATDTLRQKASIKMNRKLDGHIRETTKNVNQFIKLYENGQWSTVMKAFKSGAAASFKANESTIAAEADMNVVDSIVDNGKSFIDLATKTGSFVKSVPGKIGDGVKGTWNGTDPNNKTFWNGGIGGKSAIIIGIILALLFILRKSVYLIIHGAGNLKESIKRNAEILKNSINNGSNTVDGVESQKALLNNLNKVSDVIDYKIIKSEKGAIDEIKKSDREEFNPQEIKKITGSDFEF